MATEITAQVHIIMDKLIKLQIIDSVNSELIDQLVTEALQKQIAYSNTNGNMEQIKLVAYWYLIQVGKAYCFDTECIANYPMDYQGVWEDLVRISDNCLQGVKLDVTGKWGEGPIVKAQYGEHAYKSTLAFASDYCDVSGLLNFLNQIVAHTKENRRFYQIPITDDQRASVFFLNS